MSSPQNQAAASANAQYERLARQYYGIALPGLAERDNAISGSLAQGEPEFLKSAFGAQRTGLTEGMTAQGDAALAAQTRSAAGATRGGNPFATLHPAQIGAQLANALYGSRFQEGQANIDQAFGLMSMGLGGAGTSGSGALTAAGSQLRSIGFLPNYNPTLAMISGIGSLAGSAYGAISQPDVNRSFPGSIYNPMSPSSWSGSAWNQWAGVPGASSVNLTSFSAE